MELKRLEPIDRRLAFSCGNDDLDEFYATDSVEGGRQLLCVTYVFLNDDGNVIAFFSVSNDAIKKEDVPRSAFQRMARIIPFGKRYSTMPAAKIGRLAVASAYQGQGYGTKVLDYLKVWFTKGNKTGCRFLIVDAYNKEKNIRFYARNGFRFLTSKDESEETRLMYFDLITFRE